MIKILYEDNHLLVVEKPINIPVQSDISGDDKKKLTVPDLLDMFSKASGSTEANDAMLLSK